MRSVAQRGSLYACAAGSSLVVLLGCASTGAAHPDTVARPTTEAGVASSPSAAAASPHAQDAVLKLALELRKGGLAARARWQTPPEASACLALDATAASSTKASRASKQSARTAAATSSSRERARTKISGWKGCAPLAGELRYEVSFVGEPRAIPGARLFPALRDREGAEIPARLTLTLTSPEKVELESSLPLATEGLATDLATARQALFAFGPYARERVAVGEGELVLLTRAGGASAASALAKRLRSLAPTVAEAGTLPRRALLVVEPTARGMRSETMAGGTILETDRAASVIGHHEEVVLSEALARIGMRADGPELRAGWAAYNALVARARVGWISVDDAIGELMESYRRYRGAVGVRRIAEGDDLAWSRDAALQWAFCVDSALLERGAHFADVHRAAAATGGPAGEAIVQTIAKDSKPIAGYARALLLQRGLIDVGACLERVGYRLTAELYDAIEAAKVGDVLRTKDNLPSPPTVGAPRPTSGFAANDRLIAIDKEPIHDLADLGWLLRDRPLNTAVRFRVLRGDQLRSVTHRIPNLAALSTRAIRWNAYRLPDTRKVSPFGP